MRLDLTPKQMTRATIFGTVGFVVVLGGVTAWLWSNKDITLQNRLAQTPSVTNNLKAETPPVPASWQTPPVPSPTAAAPASQDLTLASTPPEHATSETKEEPKPEVKAEAKPEVKVETPATALPAKEPLPAPVVVQPAWQKFARPFDPQNNKPRIAIVIADMGLAAASTQSAIQDLPSEVTLSFSSLAPQLETDMLKAHTAGHEMLLAIPMEPEGYPQNDAGPGSLLTALQDPENVKRLERGLARSEGYVGIMPQMGGKFVTLESKLAPVLDVLKKEELLVLDGTMSNSSLIAPLARLVKIPFARADVVVDMAARDALDTALTGLENTARERGLAVAVIKPYPVVFEKLATWAKTLDGKNILLAPISAVSTIPTTRQETPPETPPPPAAEVHP